MKIKQIQCLLEYLGYEPGPIDGANGPNTRDAVTAFQRAEGLTVDGIAGSNTQAKLLEAVAQGRGYDPGQASTGGETAKTGTFWDDIEYFTREEFKCKCGGKYCNGYPDEPDERMVRIADQLRKNLGVPITIISGLRCKTWNAIQGGVSNSQHMYGEAADIYAMGVPQSRVEAELDKIGGVRYHYAIKGSSNVHFDVPKGNR